MSPNKVIGHKTTPKSWCPDASAALWVVKRKYPGIKVIGCCYQDEPPILQPGDNVLIVDFSFPLQVLLDWQKQEIKIQVIDHHKTAMQDLSQFSNAIFNMEKCGALLTWETLFPSETVPEFMYYVDARDRWLKNADSPWWDFALPNTAAYYGAMKKLGRTQAMYDKLAPMNRKELEDFLLPIGQPELDKKIAIVENISERAFFINFCGHEPVASLRLNESESRLVSDVASCLYKQHPVKFVAIMTSDNKWSLRSDNFGQNFDVGNLARTYGGGGHHNSSGVNHCPEITVKVI